AQEKRRARMVDRAEAQRIQIRDRARAHREDVAQDASDAGGRALERLDEGRMIVTLDLEDDRETVAHVDRPRVLAGPLQDACSGCGIMPNTLPRALRMAAIAATEPFQLASEVTRPSASV